MKNDDYYDDDDDYDDDYNDDYYDDYYDDDYDDDVNNDINMAMEGQKGKAYQQTCNQNITIIAIDAAIEISIRFYALQLDLLSGL